MTKGFYKLMCLATAAAMSIIGCGGEDDPAPEYGSPVDNCACDADQYQNDNGFPDDYMDTPVYGVDVTKYDEDALTTDTDEPVVDPDGLPMEYGPVQTDYDGLTADTDEPVISDDPPMEYGPIQTDYDAAGTDEAVVQPDEMTTDYGPVSRSFLKK